ILCVQTSVLGQEELLAGKWSTSLDFTSCTYTFDSSNTVTIDWRSCMSRYRRSGHYYVHQDSIFINLDSLTDLGKQLNRTNAQRTLPYKDTLFIIGAHEIKIGKNTSVYNTPYDEGTFSITDTGLLTFTLRAYVGILLIQQVRFYTWQTVDTLLSPKSYFYFDLQQYKLPMHSGANEFRIMNEGKIVKTFTVDSKVAKVTLHRKRIKDRIVFSSATCYELMDVYGHTLLKGTSTTIDCSSLPKGTYFLKYD
ncbi:MAG: hypothetical protein H7259_08020, partial [Cytophagales bacterium]|nr:hypothetical protein [Cytophaga sp.]